MLLLVVAPRRGRDRGPGDHPWAVGRELLRSICPTRRMLKRQHVFSQRPTPHTWISKGAKRFCLRPMPCQHLPKGCFGKGWFIEAPLYHSLCALWKVQGGRNADADRPSRVPSAVLPFGRGPAEAADDDLDYFMLGFPCFFFVVCPSSVCLLFFAELFVLPWGATSRKPEIESHLLTKNPWGKKKAKTANTTIPTEKKFGSALQVPAPFRPGARGREPSEIFQAGLRTSPFLAKAGD